MTQTNGILGILFDFDETLNNTHLGSLNAWNGVTEIIQEYLKKQGVIYDQETLLSEIIQLDRDMNRIRQYNRDEWWNQLISQKTSMPSNDFVEDVTEKYWALIVEGSELYPDTLDTLRYLKEKEYQLGLLSDTDYVKGMKMHRIIQSGLTKWFKAIVISGESGLNTKPHPEAFQLLAQQLNLSPENCIFVGDKPFADIKGAKDAGMTTILIHRKDWDLIVEPDFIIKSLREIQEIV